MPVNKMLRRTQLPCIRRGIRVAPMPDARAEIPVIIAGLLAWAAIFLASAQGLLHVGWMVSDGLLALLAAFVAWRLWRLYRRRGGA